MIDGILYHVGMDKSLQRVLPKQDRYNIFKEVHQGKFAGHLRDAKIHGQLSKTYWWPHMRKDITSWCRACEICTSRHVGKPIKPFLTPIPVGGPFDQVGMDIIKFPKSNRGKIYAVVFIDYLTKWPKVFATSDQTSLTVAELLVEHVIPRHGVPSELLSDRGTAFLSQLMLDVYKLMGITKTNTTAYHPQTDGSVERFHRTLTDMLAKNVDESGKDWDKFLPYVLFANRSSLQKSTGESPFHLLYGRDPWLPTDEILDNPEDRRLIDARDYKEEMSHRFAVAWRLARAQVEKAQQCQKFYHDKLAKQPDIKVGDRVFVYHPAEKRGKAYKFSRPFVGPYCVLTLYPNGAEVKLVAKPVSKSIHVALNRVRLCPNEILDQSVTQGNTHQCLDEESAGYTTVVNQLTSIVMTDHQDASSTVTTGPTPTDTVTTSAPWPGRLRSRKKAN